IHVQPRVFSVAGTLSEGQTCIRTDGADRTAGKKTKRRRPPRHAREVAHQRTFHLLTRFAFRFAEPDVEAFVEIGGGDKECFSDLGARADISQISAKTDEIPCYRRFMLCGILCRCHSLLLRGPCHQLVKWQQGRSQSEKARRGEAIEFLWFFHRSS